MTGLKLLSKNSKGAFKNIFLDYYKPLYHLGNYYLNDEEEAKEIVQEAFIKLWELRHELNPDSNLQNFLFTLVKNNCLNILKRRQILLKHHGRIREKEIYYQYESLSRINDDYLELTELKDKIETAIKNLPEHCRVVFELSRFEEMKNREIAEKLGITQKAVEARMTKALKILRNELKDYLPFAMVVMSIFD
ncbi:RNA polymerase sigma-70 factor, ECF subfamily [Mariniphaga anaerophila]|uniref:RNA polymerase sigma-70 factor, ECF subfamily n=1 Tax=Mariniphaga anaerophila TaxID=1484053 RepID=A0A1M4SQL3_9BACT|nr:RNA polymerase sigma-70 factor [Mariniphaga anaerophila]SHE34544.1 RNA polymerase sigma-70 factor, ECF subfamily [Mariniphaga anaerophila]